ncbi:hypothetical protein HO173_004908 [Letharia columbiana]|uniref:RRM domain-containing protein n=1 Tax=Letharia columbiana TaxID=112416 RepID=A0A8H6FYG4_9LECA|nr:uncharacterized protein HO173_004908 [Letharia columbiana]KAF6237029.1 hypothetical protein HO173_004908 [Letharia columbiana]
MAAEEDNFDIDIYGDGGEDDQNQEPEDGMKAEESSDQTLQPSEPTSNAADHSSANDQRVNSDVKIEHEGNDVAQKIASTDESGSDPVQLPKQAPQTQGLKRKDGVDDRYVDPGATTALFVSELHWWVNDDDVRGWANQSQCEDELEDMTFSEHKVNGKSKGQAYVLFKTPQAATAAKHKIESFGEGQQYTKKFTVSYTNPYTNPFRTLPKDGPARNNAPVNNNRSTSGSYGGAGAGGTGGTPQSFNNGSGGYRGNRGGGYNNRGGGMNNMSGYSRGGFQQPVTGSFQGSGMGGFQGSPMGGMQSYGGFQTRGAMMGGMRGGPMGMRGGRGGINPSGIMGMPMTGMGMSAMGGMGMSMPQMNGGMGMQAHYNPAFFTQQQQGQQGGSSGDANWNPHGAKRTRQE